MLSILLNPEVRPVWRTDDEAGLLAAYERVWDRKRILRQLYETWYEQIADALRPGLVLELGAGTGNFKRWFIARATERQNNRATGHQNDRPDHTHHARTAALPLRRSAALSPSAVLTIDILPGHFVDVQADALQLPLPDAAVPNIVLIDTLHHLARPLAFLGEATRVLEPGGRLILLEPFVSWWGGFVYRYLHHEPVDFSFTETTSHETHETHESAAASDHKPSTIHHPPSTISKPAWEGNAAIPKLVLREFAGGSRAASGSPLGRGGPEQAKRVEGTGWVAEPSAHPAAGQTTTQRHPSGGGDLASTIPSSLRLVQLAYSEFLSYPLSGGFSYRCLLPEAVLLGLHRLERTRLFRNRFLSLRVFAVLQKV